MINKSLRDKLLKLRDDINNLIDEDIIKPTEHIQEIENNYLSKGNTKILIVIPTEKKMSKMHPGLEKLITPTGCQIKFYNVFGLSVADAYNNAVQTLLQDDADYLFTVEDDTFPDDDVLINLMKHCENGMVAVGAWYPKKNSVKEGVHIILGNKGRREELRCDNKVHEVYTLAMGATLYKREIFKYISAPWFETTDNLTQDSFFSQKARQMGYKLYCDTSIKCKHIDRDTGEIFE